MFAGGFGRDRESAEELRKAAALVAKQDLTAFLLFGVAIEIVAYGCLYFGKSSSILV